MLYSTNVISWIYLSHYELSALMAYSTLTLEGGQMPESYVDNHLDGLYNGAFRLVSYCTYMQGFRFI